MEVGAVILFSIIFYGLRIFGVVYCAQKADKLNRSTGGWAVFGLFFPIIAIIWISNLKKNIIWHDNIEITDKK
jgi:hypothetical protein